MNFFDDSLWLDIFSDNVFFCDEKSSNIFHRFWSQLLKCPGGFNWTENSFASPHDNNKNQQEVKLWYKALIFVHLIRILMTKNYVLIKQDRRRVKHWRGKKGKKTRRVIPAIIVNEIYDRCLKFLGFFFLFVYLF